MDGNVEDQLEPRLLWMIAWFIDKYHGTGDDACKVKINRKDKRKSFLCCFRTSSCFLTRSDLCFTIAG